MKALTLWRPWAAAICRYGKRVENRTWTPPASVVGRDVAIHAGKREDRGGLDFINRTLANRGVSTRADFGPEGIVAVVRVAGWLRHRGHPSRDEFEMIAQQHGINLAEVVRSPWWFGPVGWVLADVRVLATAVPCRGAQGLWTVPDDVAAAVSAEMLPALPDLRLGGNGGAT